jgi:hypothetical protein
MNHDLLVSAPAVEAVKKSKLIADTTQGTEIRRLGRAVYPRLR